MPRSFNTTVFDEYVEGTDAVFTAIEFSEALGRADKVRVQLIVRNSSGTSPTIEVVLQDSNDGQNYLTNTTLWSSSTSIDSTPVYLMADSGSNILGNYLRLKVTLGGTTPAAHVKLIVCGRED